MDLKLGLGLGSGGGGGSVPATEPFRIGQHERVVYTTLDDQFMIGQHERVVYLTEPE